MRLGKVFSCAYSICLPKLFSLLTLLFACAACADFPHGMIEFGSQRIQDCVPGSVSRPCS
jgi:hypothetical protein